MRKLIWPVLFLLCLSLQMSLPQNQWFKFDLPLLLIYCLAMSERCICRWDSWLFRRIAAGSFNRWYFWFSYFDKDCDRVLCWLYKRKGI